MEFEIQATQLDAQNDEANVHVWLDQATRLPLKITYAFADREILGKPLSITLVMDRFEWEPTLPANTFEPEIPTGYTEAKTSVSE